MKCGRLNETVRGRRKGRSTVAPVASAGPQLRGAWLEANIGDSPTVMAKSIALVKFLVK